MLQVRWIVEKLAKRCGFEVVAQHMPEAHAKLLSHIRKENNRRDARRSVAGSQVGTALQHRRVFVAGEDNGSEQHAWHSPGRSRDVAISYCHYAPCRWTWMRLKRCTATSRGQRRRRELQGAVNGKMMYCRVR